MEGTKLIGQLLEVEVASLQVNIRAGTPIVIARAVIEQPFSVYRIRQDISRSVLQVFWAYLLISNGSRERAVVSCEMSSLWPSTMSRLRLF